MTGQVICVYRILPKNPEKIEDLKKALDKVKPQRIEEEPIAFGLKALIVTILIPEIEGKLEETEKMLDSLPGVQNVENIRTSRSL